MTKPEESELFEFLARQSKLREWLDTKLAAEITVLVNMADADQLRRAQGRAQVYQQFLSLMDAAKK